VSKRKYTGINIQWPISELILSGQKTVETRKYPLPKKYLDTELALVETPGDKGKFNARVTAIIKIKKCFQYKSKSEFYRDNKRHCVTPDSKWAWDSSKPKWGWEITVVKKLKNPKLCTPKGIVYRKGIEL
jgi:hypothetical protein